MRVVCLLAGVVAALSACASVDRSDSASTDDSNIEANPVDVLPPIPSDLRSLSAGQLAELFGPAAFQRVDGPAEILRYDSRECVLHVILYRDTDASPPHVAHIDARDRSLEPVAESMCVESLVRAQHTRPTS